ncbi:M48 family metalloprotease [candidate division KSB3 bacterium]|uniref:M48 family metalloprotease n=1 Tax=candidate division KSB3 bacterium TaxID=2044937 RepID=A0A9D5Q6W9_9BACT|nr:M48 family metalloprotease [candidate division KSB3 bacterium]MBD3326309.1 M48 family metalloprotease [candidate division KSB3 bacterium]
MMHRYHTIASPRLVSVVLVILVISGCAYQLGDLENPGRGFNLVSEGAEIEMGMEAANEIESEIRIIRNPEIQQYITNLGQYLVQYSRRPNLRYAFKVVDTDEINAFALPGGFIYINRGLIVEADSEAELAGVIAHEIGHVVARHGAKRMSQIIALQLGLSVFESLSDQDRRTQITALVAQALATGFLLKNSRDNERQADDLGTETLYRAGYDPIALARFFDKLSQQYSPSSIEVFLSTHPSPGERVGNVQALIATFPPRPYVTDTPQFDHIKQMLSANTLSAPQTRQKQGVPQAPRRRMRPGAVGGSYRRR